MSELMTQLHTDHINTARVLDLLEAQAELLQAGEPGPVALMVDILRYLTQFTDLVHHPREDRVFARLRRRDGAAAATLDVLESEHRELAAAGLALISMLRDAGHDAGPPDELADALAAYVGQLRQHMNVEESQIFPLARALLTHEDWRGIESETQAEQDPLFGGRAAQSYGTLRDTLAKRRSS